jgi:hypothetical protein
MGLNDDLVILGVHIDAGPIAAICESCGGDG